MTDDRTQRAISADGTEIVGRVQGQGPPLVLAHAPVHDADMAWQRLLPHLTGRFTCHTPDLRGRGSSGDAPDHSPARFVEDVTAYVDSIGEPVAVMGWSDSSSLALGAAARSGVVSAVVAYEPSVWNLMREDDLAGFRATMAKQAEAMTDGRWVDAAHTFHRFVCNDEEFAALDADYLDRQARMFPLLYAELPQRATVEGPEPTDPRELGRVHAPVLVLLGRRTRLATWFDDSARHVARHLVDGHVRELPDVGHFAPLVAPEPVAAQMTSFLASVRQPA